MTFRLTAALLALLLSVPASARMHAGPNQLSAGHRLQGAIAPLDGGGSFGAPAAAYSLRRLKSTYAGPAVKLRRASDSAVQDINFLGFTGFTGAPIDTAAAAAFCAATTCFYDTWYDQSGLGRDNKGTSPGAEPQYVASCSPNGLPCARITSSGQFMQWASPTPGSTMTFSAVAKRTGVNDCYWITNASANAFLARGGANSWQLIGGVGSNTATAADGVWHAGVGVMNFAASLVRIDAAESVPSNIGYSPSTGEAIYLIAFAGASTQCDMTEAILWDPYVLTASERAVLTANQRSWMGLP